MRVFTEKKYQAMLAEHAFQVECSVSDLHVIKSERDYYREARENALSALKAACDLANERRGEIQRLNREAAARITEVETMDSVIQYWMEQAEQARSKRDEWANKAIEVAKERDEARAEVENYRDVLEEVQNELDDSRCEVKKLERQADILAAKVADAYKIIDELPTVAEYTYEDNAAQADEALDSFDESGCDCEMCADPTGIDEDGADETVIRIATSHEPSLTDLIYALGLLGKAS